MIDSLSKQRQKMCKSTHNIKFVGIFYNWLKLSTLCLSRVILSTLPGIEPQRQSLWRWLGSDHPFPMFRQRISCVHASLGPSQRCTQAWNLWRVYRNRDHRRTDWYLPVRWFSLTLWFCTICSRTWMRQALRPWRTPYKVLASASSVHIDIWRLQRHALNPNIPSLIHSYKDCPFVSFSVGFAFRFFWFLFMIIK